MKRIVIGITRAILQSVYDRACARSQRVDEVLFVSRQSDTASYDFTQVARAFEARGWTATMHLKKVRMRNILAYAGHMLQEARLLARCRIAVLDRYDPVVSLLTFDCERAGDAGAAERGPSPLENARTVGGEARDGTEVVNVEFPARPVILQIWHAFGAFKKFGFQSVGTPEGHSAAFTSAFDIHRNYSWVACSGEACRQAFAEAFSRPVERVVALDRPEYDELVELEKQLTAAKKERLSKAGASAADVGGTGEARLHVLMAPTLRINSGSAHPFRDLYERRDAFEKRIDAEFTWTFHPLEDNAPAPGNASDALLECDCVVTDYSSIVYEAYLLGKDVLFYMPDLESYLVSPGLNVNPLAMVPGICAQSEDELAELLAAWSHHPESYPRADLERFAGSAFDERDRTQSSAAERIADFAIRAIS